MGQPEDIPEDRERSFHCECGGSITEISPGSWECDSCNFKKENG